MNYLKRGLKSLNLLKNNLQIYIPDIIFIFIALIISLIFLNITGLYDIIQTQQPEQLTNFIRLNLTKTITFTSIYLIILFLLSVQLSSTKYSIIKDLIQDKKINLKNSFNEGLGYYTKILLIKLLVFLIFLIPLIIVIILNLLIKSMLIKSILILLLVLSWLILIVLFIYKFPILFLSKIKNPIQVLKESYSKVLKNKTYTIIILLIIILIFITSILISLILNLFIINTQSLSATAFNTILELIKILLGITASLLSLIYLFLSFKELPS